MQPDAARLRKIADALDGINEAMRVVASAADERDRVSVDKRGHGIDIRGEGIRERRVADLDTHPVGALAQGHVRSQRHDDVGRTDPAGLPRFLAIGVQRVDEAVAAAGGDHADGLRVVQQLGCHGDDLALELRRGGVHVTLQDIGVREVLEDLGEKVVVLVVATVEAA